MLLGALAALAVLGPIGLCGGLFRSAEREVPEEAPLALPPPHKPPDPTSWSLLRQAFSNPEKGQELLTQVSQREGMSLPVPRRWDDPFEDISDLRPLLDDRRDLAAEQQDPGQRARLLVEALRVGVLLKDGDTNVIGLMYGVAYLDTEELHALGLEHSGDTRFQRELLHLLQDVETQRSMARAVALECRLMEGVLREPDPSVLLGGSPKPWLRYSPETTTAWHRRDCRLQVEQLQKPFAGRTQPPREAYWEGAGPARLVHNPVGRMLMDLAFADWSAYAEGEDLAMARLAALKALTALRAGQEPALEDPLGGRFEVLGDELVSSHDGEDLGGGPQTLRWPIRP